MTDTTTPARRTKRRYAHELFPHPAEGESRPLAVDVPYCYAIAFGLSIEGTDWQNVKPRTAAGERIVTYIEAFRRALLADALQQGLTGQGAWDWVNAKISDDMEMAEWRGYEILTDDVVNSIKPYPCGPEPTHHEHYDPPTRGGARRIHVIQGRESECLECTEPITKES